MRLGPYAVTAALLAAVALAAVALAPGARSEKSHVCLDCNVLLISIDTLRADHLGCYGYDRPTSPNIDQFSAESVLFQTAIAHAPSTTPSHASIFTSRLPEHHGAWRSRNQPIARELRTMAEILKEAGLRTASFNGGGQVAASYGFNRGFETYESSPSRFAEKADQAIRWFQRNPDQRFFMFLHTYEVHAPYEPEPTDMATFDGGYTGAIGDAILPGLLIDINDGKVALSAPDARHIINAYDAEIRSMDRGFRQLIAYLRKSGLLDRTIVIFTSDHGEEFGEHGQMGRHSHALYDELLRVPLLLRLPEARLGSTRVEAQVRGIDLLPTVMDLLGRRPLQQFDGTSLLPLMAGASEPERVALSQLDAAVERPPTSIRTRSSKLVRTDHAFVEGAPFRWYERQAEVVAHPHGLGLPIESFHVPRRVRVSIDGRVVKEAVIQPRRQLLLVPFPRGDTRGVTIESLDPCTRPADVGANLGLPCVSFRLFSASEYFRLDRDPSERQNLLYEASERSEVMRLDALLEGRLASHPRPGTGPVELDAETRRRLSALGYVD